MENGSAKPDNVFVLTEPTSQKIGNLDRLEEIYDPKRTFSDNKKHTDWNSKEKAVARRWVDFTMAYLCLDPENLKWQTDVKWLFSKPGAIHFAALIARRSMELCEEQRLTYEQVLEDGRFNDQPEKEIGTIRANALSKSRMTVHQFKKMIDRANDLKLIQIRKSRNDKRQERYFPTARLLDILTASALIRLNLSYETRSHDVFKNYYDHLDSQNN